MSYIVLNESIYAAALTGALAGMGAGLRVPSDGNPSSPANLAAAAAATQWAQAYDTAFASSSPATSQQVDAAYLGSLATWLGRSPGGTAAGFAIAASALVALSSAGNTALGAAGVTLPSSNIIYGDGSSGAAALDGVNTFTFANLVGSVYTLNRDVFLADASSVANGITLASGGFRIFCAGTLTNNGTISADGKNAAAGVAGGSSALGSMGIGTAGGAGGVNGVGSPGTNQSNVLQDAVGASQCVGGAGGAGGANGGGNAGTYTGGAGGNGGANYLIPFLTGYMLGQTSGGNQGQVLTIGGGSGGGGGGSDNGGVTGGGGGGGGGVLLLAVYNLVNNGTIRAKGGNGASATGIGGNGGSGGGGGGGVIQLVRRYFSGNLPTAPGGSAGAAVIGTGVAGAAGAAGHVNTGTA